MTYRSDLDALSARKAALEAEVRDRTRELDQARQLVEEHQARAKLPVLDNLRVATPCPAAWDAMIGDDRTRHCVECKKNVYNLSDMTRAEAEALIQEKEGQLCVRYFQRADGTILLNDCGVGIKRRNRRRKLAAVGVAASLAGASVGVQLGRQAARSYLGSVRMADKPVARMGEIQLPPGPGGQDHEVMLGLVSLTKHVAPVEPPPSPPTQVGRRRVVHVHQGMLVERK